MNTADNKNIILDFFKNLSTGKMDAALEYMDENIVWVISGKRDEFPIAGTFHNKKEFIEMFAAIGKAMPNGVAVTVTNVIAEGNNVVIESDAYGVSATGKIYNNKLCHTFEVCNGKIQTCHEYLDTIHAKDVLLEY